MEIFIIVLLYFLPSIIASSRKHSNSGAISVINLFLGWTFIGWVVALAWACSDNTEARTANIRIEQIDDENDDDLNLIKCHDCDKLLSPDVKFCIRCGAQIQKPGLLSAAGKILTAIVILPVIFMILQAMFNDSPGTNNNLKNQDRELQYDKGNGYTSNHVDDSQEGTKSKEPDLVTHCDAPDCDSDGTTTEIADREAAIKLIADQLNECFLIPKGVGTNTSVSADIKISRNGTMEFVKFIDEHSDYPTDATGSEAVLEAISDPVCNPLRKLPPDESYYLWREVILKFQIP